MAPLPTLFVSHGAPTTIIDPDSPARTFLTGLGDKIDRPNAIVSITAHWVTGAPKVGAAAHPETIHDFYGFPQELYEMEYPASGNPSLAHEIDRLLREAGFDSRIDEKRGLDHGTWSPLKLMYPEADIPVVQLSVRRSDPAHHLALGQALVPLRNQGVLVMGSGSTTHNLGDFTYGSATAAPWAQAFEDWLRENLEAGDWEALVAYRREAPNGERAHPSEEHLMPLFAALGAAGENAKTETLHSGIEHGSIGMSAFAFSSP